MDEFVGTRNELNSARPAAEQARLALLSATQKLQLLEQESVALDRQKGANNESYLRQRADLNKKMDAARRQQANAGEKYTNLRQNLAGIEAQFADLIDPATQLQMHFTADIPFLLLPLRLETRFKTINNTPQLWVRVYPDDCMVDSFEPLLSQREVNNAARFWAEYYSAGAAADPNHPDPVTLDAQKAAWRLLVGSAGDGRAAWITRQLRPDTANSIFPLRTDKTVILAIVAGDWNGADTAAVTGLFRDLWLAAGNPTTVSAIKDTFNTANPTLDADTIIVRYEPVNFKDSLPPGIKRSEAKVAIAVVSFIDLDSKAGKMKAWTQATRVNVLPERLALLRIKNGLTMEPVFGNTIPYPLFTSPDPDKTAQKSLEEKDGDLVFRDDIRWLADFDKAVADGMGFRINLAPDEIDGFSRLMVLGVKLGADADSGASQLENLIDHHFYSKKGFQLIPQGTPTNNTASASAGYKSADDSDASFDLYFNQTPGFTPVGPATDRADGQWLSEWLGIGYSIIQKVLHSGQHDQGDVRNMNTVLWPATLGYVMDSLMEGGFSADSIARTRDFFNQFVSGRGPVPAIRIGNQPFGILPTSAFRRQTWTIIDNRVLASNPQLRFLHELYLLLLRIETNWRQKLAGTVAQIAEASTNPYQTLLDVLAMHPNSAEYHRRYLESLIEMTNAMSLKKPGFFEHGNVVTDNMKFLKGTLGYPTDIIPQLAALLGLPWQDPVKYLIDDQPLSETNGIRSYIPEAEGRKNYLQVLLEEARQSLDAVRTGAGLSERPDAELYRLIKYAIEQTYHNSGIGAATELNAISAIRIKALKTEQQFVQQAFKGTVTESRYQFQYEKVPNMTGDKTVSEFIRDAIFLNVIPAYAKYLSEQLAALDNLKDISTARLERAFVEHLDCCSYRLDAWRTGLLTFGLADLRNNTGDTIPKQRKTGIYLGAFGWLEEVRPNKSKVITPIQLPAQVIPDFNKDGNKVFLSDSANEGYIHAPSLNQAVTAAVLRNGYISHGKPDGNNVLAVNLSSERIRIALSVIEGIQGGQSLAALLGYRLERELHDRSDLAAKKIDSYIYALRKLFPLAAQKIKETKLNSDDPSVDPDTVPVTALEARNVVHGVNLLNYVKQQSTANQNFPFGLGLANPDPAVGTAITDAVNHIKDIADALADLGVAESVHHMVMGNTDRAAGVLDTFSKGNYPQEPDVIRTPRSGATLTHRVGIPFTYIETAPADGPRGQTEPSVNKWLETILPPMNKVVCPCEYTAATTGLVQPKVVSMAELGLQPIDLVYLLNTVDNKAMNEMDDLLAHFVFTTANPQVDADLVFNYTARLADPTQFSLFEIMPLVKSLRVLLLETAKLQPADMVLPNEATKKDQPLPELPKKRVEDLITSLETVMGAPILATLQALPDQESLSPAAQNALYTQLDIIIRQFAAFLVTLGKFGIPLTATGDLYAQRQAWFVSLKARLKDLVDRWQKNLDAYTVLDGQPANVENLQAKERLVSATPTGADLINAAIVIAKHSAFMTALGKARLILDSRQAGIANLLQDLDSFDPGPFDVIPFDTSPERKKSIQFVYDLKARAKTIVDEVITKRVPDANALLGALATTAPENQANQIELAARAILGDVFKMIPRYRFSGAQAAEIGNAWNDMDVLLDYSKTVGGRTHPAEDWMHGIARVHDKMKHVENCLVMREAFALPEEDLQLHPLQFPYSSSDYNWLALPFPASADLEQSNSLLYTSLSKKGEPAPTEVCGMLIDEWTELIPATEEITGLSFHFDRPNAEAPQTWLLVTAPSHTGNWHWADLADALVETLDAARMRGIEPDKIDATGFAPFFPAVFGAESLYPYTIVMDNRVHYMTAEAVSKIGSDLTNK